MTPSEDRPAAIHVRAHSKLNLFLRVAGRRPDGFHELESIFHGVDLADTLSFVPAAEGIIDVETEWAPGLRGTLPIPDDNLVTKVARTLLQPGATHPGVRVDIHKHIPLGSGLGGGSADAAATLVALNEMWSLKLDRVGLAQLGAEIGSDVPFCLSGGTALAMDRGADLTALPAPRDLHLVLGLSFEPLSTRDVYEAWDRVGSSSRSSSAAMTLALGTGDLHEMARSLHNDLEEPALTFRPELSDRKAALVAAGALGAGMSGSGPTLFGLAEDKGHAAEIALGVAGRFDRVVTVTSSRRGVERVA